MGRELHRLTDRRTRLARVEDEPSSGVRGTWLATPVPQSSAGSKSVVEMLELLDGEFRAVADAVQNGRYAFWLGSGISKERVADLTGVVKQVLDFLQSSIDPGDDNCKFRTGLMTAIALGELTAEESASIDVASPTNAWPLLDALSGRLVSKYSDLLDIRIRGEQDDYLLWDAVDVRKTYPPDANPDCEHLCLAILSIEGVVPKLASANWDGLIEAAVNELAERPDDILQVIVRNVDVRNDDARTALLKFHGCAVLASVDEATYRPLLIARKEQITSWMQNPDFEIMRNDLKQLATSKPALVLGLSIQDINIQQVFTEARFTMPWTWPSTPPAAVFSGKALGTGHIDILKQVYPADYTTHQDDIKVQSLIPTYAKPILVALVVRTIFSKLAGLARLADAGSLPDAEWVTLIAGLRTLREELVEQAHTDYIGFIRRFATEAGDAVYRFQRGRAAPIPRYRSLTAHPVNRIGSEPALATSGAPELASALAVIGLGHQRGLWSVRIGPTATGSAGSLRIDSPKGEAAVFFAANGAAEIQLGISGLVNTSAPDAIVIQSMDGLPAMSRSPRGAPGRTGAVNGRRIAIGGILAEATSADEFLDEFRMAVGL